MEMDIFASFLTTVDPLGLSYKCLQPNPSKSYDLLIIHHVHTWLSP